MRLSPQQYRNRIASSGKTIYDPIEIGDPQFWIPSPELEELLNNGLKGLSLAGLPLRTRSKVLKAKLCEVLGYPVPSSFKKTQPRFPGQNLDTYIQKSNNLQVWNEELSPNRRYAIIQVGQDDRIRKIKVVTGETLSLLDPTGTLTQKYQARLNPGTEKVELVSKTDTEAVSQLICDAKKVSLDDAAPTDPPTESCLLSISEVSKRLSTLIGTTIRQIGSDQERRRGAELHKATCKALGYGRYSDDGQFPDVRQQILEVKLQTSPTIDLGLVLPTSKEPLDLPMIRRTKIRHCDTRYAIFYGTVTGGAGGIKLTNLYVTTGADFFSRFTQFGGKVLNRKLQIPLPNDFFL